jgi:hypothetical protein
VRPSDAGATWVPGFLRILDQGHMAFRKAEPLLQGLTLDIGWLVVPRQLRRPVPPAGLIELQPQVASPD